MNNILLIVIFFLLSCREKSTSHQVDSDETKIIYFIKFIGDGSDPIVNGLEVEGDKLYYLHGDYSLIDKNKHALNDKTELGDSVLYNCFEELTIEKLKKIESLNGDYRTYGCGNTKNDFFIKYINNNGIVTDSLVIGEPFGCENKELLKELLVIATFLKK